MRTLPLILSLCLFAAPAFGQGPPPPPPEGEEPAPEERERFMERVRMMRMYALTEALELDEATAAKLFPYLREGDNRLEEFHKQKRDFRRQLRDMVKADTYDKAMATKLLRGITELEVAIATEHSKQVKGLAPMLSIEQQVKFVMTRQRFEQQVREMIRDEKRSRRDRKRDGRERRRGGE